jgi:hypothetical protein
MKATTSGPGSFCRWLRKYAYVGSMKHYVEYDRQKDVSDVAGCRDLKCGECGELKMQKTARQAADDVSTR